ncbi:internal scaffolding protein [Blackfly microvirus SF02]|uniref:Internal scaffolding protein n=1 Tax=Blackfly microvirus SF02 TaxID=2576452 RepID=A0A4P8PKC5_9VIRU|nr:internal scaffolding protein [Blackfly microvirus SF02]
MRAQLLNDAGEEMSSTYVPHDPVDLDTGPESLTRQEFADECDINILMAQYEKTGVINHFNRTPPQYLDLVDTPDLQGALTILHEAETAFMTLSAAVRREFDNDPVKFVAFASEAENLPRMREWGLAAPEMATREPIEVRVVPPPADTPSA